MQACADHVITVNHGMMNPNKDPRMPYLGPTWPNDLPTFSSGENIVAPQVSSYALANQDNEDVVPDLEFGINESSAVGHSDPVPTGT